LNPGPNDLHRIALIYQDLGRCDQALAILNRLIDHGPGEADLFSDKAFCEQELGRASDAVSDLRHAIGIEPALLPAYLTLGTVYMNEGRFEEALRVFDDGLKRARKGDKLAETILESRRLAASKAGEMKTPEAR
jgi:superkiller protein 3